MAGISNVAVVDVGGAWKRFKGKEDYTLCDLNMHVEAASIYALLGPSGCGKTTLFSCILGLQKIDGGHLTVWGNSPRSSTGSGIDLSKVGYMPQDICLYPKFTIEETLYLFGIFHGMPPSKIKENITLYVNLLELPSKGRFVENLSGGQQRRVSFAVALFHNPDLLILDEPTVGVDPLLRQTIWEHLLNLVNRGKTIVISTHYVDEVKRASKVGFMRDGRIICENSPSQLLKDTGLDSLDDVFVTLAKKDAERREKPCPARMMGTQKTELRQPYLQKQTKPRNKTSTVRGCLTVLKGMIWKEYARLYRNIFLLLITVALPTFTVSITAMILGDPIPFVNLIYVNDELPKDPLCHQSYQYPQNRTCGSSTDDGSCIFMYHFNHSNSKSILNKQIIRERITNAAEELDVERSQAIIHFPANFTQNFERRAEKGIFASDDPIDNSRISVTFDGSNPMLTFGIIHMFIKTSQDFISDVLQSCGLNPYSASVPMKFEAVYPEGDHLNARGVTGIVVVVHFAVVMYFTSASFSEEKRLLLLDRLWISGLRHIDFVFGYLLVQFVTSLSNMSVAMAIATFLFQLPFNICPVWPLLLLASQTATAIAFGFLLALLFSDETELVMMEALFITCSLLSSGTVTPIEFLPHGVREIVLALPCTSAVTSLRIMTDQGLGPTHPLVLPGFVIPWIWATVFFVAIVGITKWKSR